jgi:hypothetical protein
MVINHGPVYGKVIGQDFSNPQAPVTVVDANTIRHVQPKEIGQQIRGNVTVINHGPVYGGHTGQKF